MGRNDSSNSPTKCWVLLRGLKAKSFLVLDLSGSLFIISDLSKEKSLSSFGEVE